MTDPSFSPLKLRPLTPEQVALRWGCSSNHVRNLIKRGDLRAFRLGERLLRVPIDAVEEYEAQPFGMERAEPSLKPSHDAIVLTHSANLPRRLRGPPSRP